MDAQTIICPNCQTPNPAKNLYCLACGKPLMITTAAAFAPICSTCSPSSPKSNQRLPPNRPHLPRSRRRPILGRNRLVPPSSALQFWPAGSAHRCRPRGIRLKEDIRPRECLPRVIPVQGFPTTGNATSQAIRRKVLPPQQPLLPSAPTTSGSGCPQSGTIGRAGGQLGRSGSGRRPEKQARLKIILSAELNGV